MGRHTVEVSAVAQAGAETVFELLAGTAGWPTWSPLDEAVLVEPGRDEPEGVGARRRMRAGRTTTIEEVEGFDRPHRFAYRNLEGLPVRDYRAEVTVQAAAERGPSTIVWRSTYDARPGAGLASRLALRRFLRRTVAGLAAAAERQDSGVRPAPPGGP